MRGKRTWGVAGLALVLLIIGTVALVLHRGRPAVAPVPLPGPSGAPGSAAWGVDAYSAPPGAVARLERAMGHPFGAYSVYVGLDAAAEYPTPIARDAMSRNALIYLNINASRRAGRA